jgi:hypothetical protein
VSSGSNQHQIVFSVLDGFDNRCRRVAEQRATVNALVLGLNVGDQKPHSCVRFYAEFFLEPLALS